MILLIDNYDSFTYNLYQYLGELGESIIVKRNDELTISEIKEMNPEAIVISPGPGRPEEAGICVKVIQQLHTHFPILGICLGHQAIGYSFGAKIVKAEKIMHGKVSEIRHQHKGIFQSFPQNLKVMRYHSLVIQKDTLPAQFEVLATSTDDDEIMAIKHLDYPLYGMQFHPESIGTETGSVLLKQFLRDIREEVAI
jgi:anthranilate synthase/aminodeoxychorismate synthase-like glutamine amidotransferase